MQYLVSAAEMKRYDNNTIEKIGIPALVLMERAALAAFEKVQNYCENGKKRHILVMAGVGNNGADGLALARLLAEASYSVEVWCVGNTEKATKQWRQQAEILKYYPVKMGTQPKNNCYDVLVDGLFGVGLSREVKGEYAEAISLFNRLEGWKLALDIPSGIDADFGKVLGSAVKANETVTFGFCKRGLVLYPGCEYAGKVHVADIGISGTSFLGEEPRMIRLDTPICELLPKRQAVGNKGTFGKVLLVAGSMNMAGAALLSARAAYRTGAGMVKVITAPENRVIVQETLPEALLGSMEDLKESLRWADVLAIGPGLGKEESAKVALEMVITDSEKPLLIDADGLNLLAEDASLRRKLAQEGRRGRSIILTPHVGELSRLVGKSILECKEDLLTVSCALSAELHSVVVAKDARTYICQEQKPICLNTSGNSGMATAGSGDVLSGIIVSLMGQGMDAFEAACVGVYLHGKAGDKVAEKLGEHACMAGDMADLCGSFWKE